MHSLEYSVRTAGLVTPPLIDDEGIVYAEIDINRCIEPKQYHDIIGGYNRFEFSS